MKKVLLMLLLPLFIMAQSRPTTGSMFLSSDTLFQTGTTDTVEYRLGIGSYWSDWYACDSALTTAEKVAEQNEFIPFSEHTNWFWGEFLQLRIINEDTLNSQVLYIGNKAGAVSAILVPDSVNTDTLLFNNSVWGGN